MGTAGAVVRLTGGLSSGLNRGFPGWPEAARAARLDPCSWDNMMKRPPASGCSSRSPAMPGREPARPSVSDTGTDLAEKADTAMYENNPDDRFEAALRLAEVDPAQAAEAFRSIAADDAVDPATRAEAAHRLAEVDPAQAQDFPGFAPWA